MPFPVGQMSLGGLLIQAFKILITRLPTLLVISLVLLIPRLVSQLLPPFILGPSFGPLQVLQLALIELWITILFLPFVLAATLYVVGQAHLGRSAGAGRALEFGLARSGSLLVANFLLLVLFGGLLGLPIVLVTWLGDNPLAIMYSLAAYLPIVPVVLYLLLIYLFVTPAVVVEGSNPFAAFGRSRLLTAGSRLRALGLLILLVLISIIPSVVTSIVDQSLPSQKLTMKTDPFSLSLEITSQVNYIIRTLAAYLVVTAPMVALGSVCVSLLYFDARARREGFNLTAAAQQWG